MSRAIPLMISFATVLVFVTACGSSQQLHVETSPSGAEVYLQRRGTYQVSASVDGIGGEVDGDSFEDDFYLIGTTPVDYDFDLSDTQSSFYIPGVPAGMSVTKIYEEGLIKIVMNGYETITRAIQFSNNEINLVLTLSPEAPVEPAAGTAERGGTGTGPATGERSEEDVSREDVQ